MKNFEEIHVIEPSFLCAIYIFVFSKHQGKTYFS